MRRPRIKVDSAQATAVYHCMSRTVNGERLFDDTAKEVLRKQLWQVADFCGVEVLTYTIMENHFHVLVRVPAGAAIDDPELLRRFSVLYPQPTRHQTAKIEVLKENLRLNAPEAESWRHQQLALMSDVSAFMKLLKQRFSVWFNRTHGRFGTLWSERFKSVLVEDGGTALRTMAAYIDLNAVRAGLVADPADYRFCGYAEAVAGRTAARRGLLRVAGGLDWSAAQADYRQTLFGRGGAPRSGAARLAPDATAEVLAHGGQLSLAAALRRRWRFFSDGVVLGSQAFVAEHLRWYRPPAARPRTTEPRPLDPITDWQGLCALRGSRRALSG